MIPKVRPWRVRTKDEESDQVLSLRKQVERLVEQTVKRLAQQYMAHRNMDSSLTEDEYLDRIDEYSYAIEEAVTDLIGSEKMHELLNPEKR